ncbi:hypothetical protein PIB30_085468 [Stylosanthes scabra]|uniref:Uncharacterized protein n=1 Tax=Stylosanthes scabra TaxID=79078 RepID=A0ABU6QSY9_9FABA|nr:hypothetical protein [Stylosanthes scabra]
MKRYKAKLEMPEDSEDSKTEEQNQAQPEETRMQIMELAIYMESALNLKRKWQEDKQILNVDSREYKSRDDKAVESLKKRKEGQTDKAEEAGLNMPQLKP